MGKMRPKGQVTNHTDAMRCERRLAERLEQSTTDEIVSSLPQEPQEGNIEYKWKLVGVSGERLEHLITQLKWRLEVKFNPANPPAHVLPAVRANQPQSIAPRVECVRRATERQRTRLACTITGRRRGCPQQNLARCAPGLAFPFATHRIATTAATAATCAPTGLHLRRTAELPPAASTFTLSVLLHTPHARVPDTLPAKPTRPRMALAACGASRSRRCGGWLHVSQRIAACDVAAKGSYAIAARLCDRRTVMGARAFSAARPVR